MAAMPQWQYGQDGPGGGSLPSFVMRTGQYSPFNPMDARRDLRPSSIEDMVRIPTAHRPGYAPYSTPPVDLPPPALAGFGYGDDFGAISVQARMISLIAGGLVVGTLGGVLAAGKKRRGMGGLIGAVTGLAVGLGVPAIINKL